MFATLIKYHFMFLCSYVFFSKLLNSKFQSSSISSIINSKKIAFLLQAIFFLIIDIILIAVRIFIPHLTSLFLFILLYIYTSFIHNTLPKIAIVSSLISVGLSYFMYLISILLTSPIYIISQNISIYKKKCLFIFHFTSRHYSNITYYSYFQHKKTKKRHAFPA